MCLISFFIALFGKKYITCNKYITISFFSGNIMRNHIKQLRKENNITLNDLSVMSDVPVEELGAIEDGTIEPTLLDAYNIKKALNQEFLADVFVFE